MFSIFEDIINDAKLKYLTPADQKTDSSEYADASYASYASYPKTKIGELHKTHKMHTAKTNAPKALETASFKSISFIFKEYIESAGYNESKNIKIGCFVEVAPADWAANPDFISGFQFFVYTANVIDC